jgi:hypothetical protein
VTAGLDRRPAQWTRPADVRAAVQRKWDSGVLLTRFAAGQAWEPLSFGIRGPAAAQIGEQLTEVRQWAADWAAVGDRSMRVEYKQVGGRHFGVNSVPCRAWLDSYDQAWTLLRTGSDVRKLGELLAASHSTRLVPWIISHPLRALRHAEDWGRLLAVVRWIEDRQAPGMYLRQVDVPGVDTKFIERHKGVLADLLDAQLDPARVRPETADFATRYGFQRKPGYLRFRVAEPFRGFTELSVRTSELQSAPPCVDCAYVVENEISFLAFPLPARAMVILGGGYAVPVLEPLRWLAGLRVVYWGDIDTHGLAILDRLRKSLPRARSMLMDTQTLLSHREHWGTEPSPVAGILDRLDQVEARLHADLVSGRYGPTLRLEQERIGFAAVEKAVASLQRM